MQYWSALQVINQVAGEAGLPKVATLFATDDVNSVQNNQMLSALNSAGNELLLYYPWEQFHKELIVQLVAGQSGYPLPDDWSYFIDQTQWDRTNHWPLSGPKSPQEWAWYKGGLVASFPRVRYRVMNNKLEFYPTPASNSSFTMSMEYVSSNWVMGANSLDQLPNQEMVISDGDQCWYHPWLLVKYTKLKWLQLKGFDQSAASADFQRMYDSLKGKDVGASVLSLVPVRGPLFIGPQNIPDGNWNV
jgi:hypothetical protein